MIKGGELFEYRGRKFRYFDHRYNNTINNERAVEVPLAMDFIQRVGMDGHLPMGHGLEVGNVLSHYTPRPFWRIVDLTEPGFGVENRDLLTISDTFDWVVSISTVEHVQHPHNLWASSAAITFLRGVVKPYGPMFITAPLGWNGILDDFLLEGGAGIPGTILAHDEAGDPWLEFAGDTRAAVRPYGQGGARSIWVGEW